MPKTEPEVFIISESEMVPVADAEASSSSAQQSTHIYEHYIQPLLAELMGSTLFIFVGCASVVSNSGGGMVQPALAHGLALGVAILLFGHISGGHFNPAVTLSVCLCGGMSIRLVLPYILVQLSGGIAGAGLVKAMFPLELYQAALGGAFNPLAISSNVGKVVLAELVMTTFLTSAVVMAAVNSKTSSPMAPFGIGLVLTANIFAGGTLSGACLNPARAFGPAVIANYWDYNWIYWVGPVCGALCTVIYVRLFLGDRKMRLILKK